MSYLADTSVVHADNDFAATAKVRPDIAMIQAAES